MGLTAKAAFVACILGLSSCASATPGALRGRWIGTLEVPGTPSNVIIDFSSDGSAAVSVPSERLLGKRVANLTIRANRTIGKDKATHWISFELPANQRLRIEAAIRDGEMIGLATAGRASIPLRLRRAGPTPPLSYLEIPVTFVSGERRFSGSLLRPRRAARPPVVVLAHGSSTPGRDDYRYFADLYARAGIAAFIFDKRPTGPGVDGGNVRLSVLANDLEAAVNAVRARPDLDGSKVGLWGFSQGGWLVPVLAARAKYAFIVSLSGPGVTYAAVNRFADGERLKREGFSEVDRQAADRALARLDDYVRNGATGEAAMQDMLDDAFSHPWARRTTLPRAVPSLAKRRSKLRWLDLDFDPAALWRKIDAPVLLMYGAADDSVPAQASADRIRDALMQDGAGEVEVRMYKRADHQLLPAPGLEEEMIAWSLRHL